MKKGLSLLLPFLALAASQAGEIEASSSAVPTQWFNLKKDSLEIYDSKTNPWLQKVEVKARFHHQMAWVDAEDTEGRKINKRYNEIRRSRLMLRTYFLKAFRFDIENDFISDDGYERADGGIRFDETDLADLFIQLDVDKLVELPWLDDLDLTYGRFRVKGGYENSQSSREIHTLQRSSLADKIRGRRRRATGFALEAEKDDWTLDFAVFSHERAEGIAGWDAGAFYYAGLEYKPNKDWKFFGSVIVSDPKGFLDYDEALDFGWVGTLSMEYEDDPYGFAMDLVMGDNGGAKNGNIRTRRGGDFYGLMAMPWVWIVEDSLKAVVRAQYQWSDESEGIRLTDRYLLSSEDRYGYELNNGRGDEHFSLYGGLNYHLMESDSKIMIGLQYDKLNTRRGSVEGITSFLGFRFEL